MKFPKQDMLDLTNEEEVEGYEVIEEGDWTQDHKSQCREIIFKHGDKYYALYESRSGSYHTDWYYDSEYWDDEVEVTEVKAVEKTITTWVEA